MVTLKEINKAIVKQVTEGLKSTDYKDIPFVSTDIREKVIRPSFYVDFAENRTSLLNAEANQRLFDVRLFYFAKNRETSKIELLEIQDLLSLIFQTGIKVSDDYYISVFECEFDSRGEEGLLITTLADLYTISEKEQTGEPLEELEMERW
ncbi:phage tail terminator family protein [Clostridium botulinum]|uniref:phage tail terminator family protein n=1 Tax=Clostridium botulinum TaxID=1491 RepID=UPI00358DC043